LVDLDYQGGNFSLSLVIEMLDPDALRCLGSCALGQPYRTLSHWGGSIPPEAVEFTRDQSAKVGQDSRKHVGPRPGLAANYESTNSASVSFLSPKLYGCRKGGYC